MVMVGGQAGAVLLHGLQFLHTLVRRRLCHHEPPRAVRQLKIIN
jgi:hypothetical protein